MHPRPFNPVTCSDLGGEVLPPRIVYFGPGEVLPGVMWVALTDRGEVWTRQLCTAGALMAKRLRTRRTAQLAFDL